MERTSVLQLIIRYRLLLSGGGTAVSALLIIQSSVLISGGI